MVGRRATNLAENADDGSKQRSGVVILGASNRGGRPSNGARARRTSDPRAKMRSTRVFIALVTVAALAAGLDASATHYGDPGEFPVSTTRVRLSASAGGEAPTSGGTPDLAGEEGEVVVHYPAAFDSEDAPSAPVPDGRRGHVLALYQHPTHGYTLEAWTSRNDAMLRLLASRGVVVCSPVRVGALDGDGASVPILGGLIPGAQRSREVIDARVYPRLQSFALRVLSAVARLSETDRSFILHDAIDVRAAAFVGFSAGAALAVYAAEASQTLWPGAVRAVVALAPTTGDSREALQELRRRAPRLEIPIALVSGREDTMGGFDGLVALGDGASRAPRVGIVAEGATHCHVYIPFGSQCASPRADLGAVAALDRHVASAFILAYAEGDANAADAVWSGASAMNAIGPWNVAVKTEPMVELSVRVPGDDLDRAGDGSASVTYAFDPRKKAWVTRLPIRAVALRAMEDTTGIRNVARCECPVEVRVTRVDAERDDSDEFSDEFSAFVDARRLSSGPAHASGRTVVARCPRVNDSNAPNVELALEWGFASTSTPLRARGRRLASEDDDVGVATRVVSSVSVSFDVVGDVFRPASSATDEAVVRAQGVGSSPVDARARLVRLRSRNVCDAGSAAYAVVRASPPALADVDAVAAQGSGPGDEKDVRFHESSSPGMGGWKEDPSFARETRDETYSLSG